jgi:hypothetical protein
MQVGPACEQEWRSRVTCDYHQSTMVSGAYEFGRR